MYGRLAGTLRGEGGEPGTKAAISLAMVLAHNYFSFCQSACLTPVCLSTGSINIHHGRENQRFRQPCLANHPCVLVLLILSFS